VRALVFATPFVILAACAGETPPPAAPPAAPAAPTVSAPAAQVPAADPAPVVEGDVTFASVRGMQVLVKRVPGAEFTAADLYVRGGCANLTKENQGIESLAFDAAASGGTRALAKEPFSRKLAGLGATITSFASFDFTVLRAKSPAASWGETFGLLADVVVAPALPAEEIELARQRALARLRHEKENGDGRLIVDMRAALFEGHPYANRAAGTIDSVARLRAEDVAPYLERLRDTNRLVLVVVGDLDPPSVLSRVRAAFASVPRGGYTPTGIPPLPARPARIVGDAFKLPTNYIDAVYAGPRWGDADFVPAILAAHALQERVFEEVRTKRNLSYAPSSSLRIDLSTPYGVLYVTAVDPTATMKVMTGEAARLGTEPLSDGDLAAIKSLYATEYAREGETTDGMSFSLGRAQLVGSDWHLARAIYERAKAATAAEVQAAAKKYMQGYLSVIVGEPGKLDPKAVGVP
jgi:predicted Zn-dependent peptidase